MAAGELQHPATAGDAALREAYQAMRHDDAIQFDLTPVTPPPQAPEWLRKLGHWIADALSPIGRALKWLTELMPAAPYARVLLWTVLVVGAAALLLMIVQRLRTGEWQLPRWRRRAELVEEELEPWMPDGEPAHAWLREADELAARGEFAEAVHHLLRRSIEDIEYRRPKLVRPALTSRDLAKAEAIPPEARTLFAPIVAAVERSLFGGRPVSEADWTATRDAYAGFALARTWRA